MLRSFALGLMFSCAWAASALAQGSDYSALLTQLDAEGCAVHEEFGVELCDASFEYEGRAVEAINFQPPGEGPYPGLLLIPGHSRTARDWVGNGLAFAKAGYACIAVSQPGYGGSEGPPDFVGRFTLAVLEEGYRRLQAESYVDATRMGIVGYSRGAMAAALLACRIDDLDAAVLGAGIYDFQLAYDETLPGIRENMLAETGMTPEAVRERSAVEHLDSLSAPLLVLHGGKDVNAPSSQALLLRQRLDELGKHYEFKLYEDAEHSLGILEFRQAGVEFLDKWLKGSGVAE